MPSTAAACRRSSSLAGLLVFAMWPLLQVSPVQGQDDDRRITGFRPRAVAVVGAKLVIAPGQVVERGNLVLRDGRIVAAGENVPVPVDASVIEAEGLVAYPAFIDAGGSMLLDPERPARPAAARDPDFRSDALAATRPDNRRGLTPEFEARSALKLDRQFLDALRAAGIASVHVAPLQAIAAGQGCLVSLSGGPERECLLLDQTFSVFQIAAPAGGRGNSTENYPTTLMGATAHLRQAFLDARRQTEHRHAFGEGAEVPRPAHDPALECLGQVLDGARRACFVADSRDAIHRALDFAEEYGLEPVLLGGRDAAECLDRLKAGPVPVVLAVDFGAAPAVEPQKPADKLQPEVKPPVRAQQDRLDQWKSRAATASRLHAEGVPVAFSSRGLEKPQDWLAQVRKCVENGLTADAALAALTQTPAGLLGAGAQLGTLEPGRLAHIAVWTGPWEEEQSQVRFVIVDGEVFEYHKDAKPRSPAASPGALPQLAGKWQVRIDSGDMRTTSALLHLTQDGKKLAGTFTSDPGNGQVTSGQVQDASAEFVVAIGAGDRAVQLTFSGQYKPATEAEAEQFGGTLKSPFGAPTNWSATRVVEETPAPENPVQITVDAEGTKPDAQAAEPPADDLPTELDSDRRPRGVPAGGKVLVAGGTVVTGAGETLTDTDVLIQQGKIAQIGPDLSAPEGTPVIDAAGWFVMPGMIDTHSHIMIESGVNESSQSIVPEVRIKDAVASDDIDEYRALAGGLTTARLLHGSANAIGGQDAVVKLKHGLTAREHVLWDAPQGVKFALGENVKSRQGRFPNTRMGVEATLKRAFYEALDYRRQWQEYERVMQASRMEDGGSKGDNATLPSSNPLAPRRDLRLEALTGIIEHDILIHSHCYRADEILMLLRTAESLGIRVQSLQHVLEGYKIAPEIVAHGASCSTFSDWWAYKIEAYDATPFNTTLLHKAGANVVVKSDNSELMRHMNQEAAKSLRYGNMPADAALQMVTLNAARELGLADRLGSIEVGKDGDLAIFNGHPLSIFARCEVTVIDGDVWFRRDQQPTAMTPAEQERSKTPPPLVLAPSEVRERLLDLPSAINAVYAVTGGTIHPVDGPDIERGVVVIADGKIQAVGAEVEFPADAAVVDASGMHVYPGLIDAGTTLGINEIRQVGVTQDFAESGRFQPDMRAGIAVNVDSELIPVARAGGVTTAFLRPNGTTVAGQYSLVQTAGWTAEEMVQDYEAGLSLDWPSDEKVQEELKRLLKDARLYDAIQSQPEESRPHVIQDPRYEALRPYVTGQKRVFIEAHGRKEIAQALLFAEEEKLKIVITGGTDAWKLAAELKRREVPVIVGPTMRGPIERWDPFDATYANPGRLHEAGVAFCIRSDNASNSRNVAFEAGICVAYGLPEEEALKAITLNAAKILEIDSQAGSLTPGKTAHLIITDGSPLQPTTQIKGVFVSGRPHLPESKQTRMYERYLQRLEVTK